MRRGKRVSGVAGPEFRRAVGENLRQLRLGRYTTQQRVGQAIGVTNRTMSNYEHGYQEPALSTAVALAAYFDVPLGALLPDGAAS